MLSCFDIILIRSTVWLHFIALVLTVKTEVIRKCIYHWSRVMQCFISKVSFINIFWHFGIFKRSTSLISNTPKYPSKTRMTIELQLSIHYIMYAVWSFVVRPAPRKEDLQILRSEVSSSTPSHHARCLSTCWAFWFLTVLPQCFALTHPRYNGTSLEGMDEARAPHFGKQNLDCHARRTKEV